MKIISFSKLRYFFEKHKDSEKPLRAWYKIFSQSSFKNLSEIKNLYPSADPVKSFTVFNIGGNKYRLVVKIDYIRQRAYIRHVLTHKEYNKNYWKTDNWFDA